MPAPISAPQMEEAAYPSAEPKMNVKEIAVEMAVRSFWFCESSAISEL